MEQEILKSAVYSKYKKTNLVEDTDYDFKFKNATVSKSSEKEIVLDGDITCTVFYVDGMSVHQRESYFTYDNGVDVIYVSDSPILPADAFETFLAIDNEENGGFALNIFLNGKYSFTSRTNAVEDNVTHEMVAGLEQLFKKNGLELFEIMECTSSITPMCDKSFKNFVTFEKEVISLIKQSGMEYDKSGEKESYKDLDFGTKGEFLKFVKGLSEEDFNDYLREEYEEF